MGEYQNLTIKNSISDGFSEPLPMLCFFVIKSKNNHHKIFIFPHQKTTVVLSPDFKNTFLKSQRFL